MYEDRIRDRRRPLPVEAYKALREVWGDSWRPKLPVMGDAEGWVLNRESVVATLKASAMDLGMDGAEFATHSLRIGGATTAMAATRLYSDDEIRRFGRWKSDCWRRYVYVAPPVAILVILGRAG